MDKLLRKGKRYVFVEVSIKGVKVKQRNEKEHQLDMQRIRRAVKSS